MSQPEVNRRPRGTPIIRAMAMPTAWDVEGPVQAEVFVVWLNDGTLELTGPCGAAPWLLELGATEHPVEVVDRIVRDVVGDPLLVHSTSWRRDRDAVILSFVVVIDPGLVRGRHGQPAGGAHGPRAIGGDGRAPRHRDGPGRRARLAPPGLAGGG